MLERKWQIIGKHIANNLNHRSKGTFSLIILLTSIILFIMFNKTFMKFSITLFHAIGLVIILLLNVCLTSNGLSVVAQTDEQQDSVILGNNSTTENTTPSKQTSHSNTFYATGERSSLNFESNSVMDIANLKNFE